MKAEEFDFLLAGSNQIEFPKMPTGAVSTELEKIKNFIDQEELSLMRRLSVFARAQADRPDQGAAGAKSLFGPGEDDIDNTLMSELLLNTAWLGQRQLEPQEILAYLRDNGKTGDAIDQFQKNLDSVVLIGRAEMIDAQGNLRTYDMAESTITTLVTDRHNGEYIDERQCRFHWRFPFRNQRTVQNVLSADVGRELPVFFGTGFFIHDNVVATAGHVVEAMARTLKTDPTARFVAVQYHRLYADTPIEPYPVDLASLATPQMTYVSGEDWGYFFVEKPSVHTVALANAANCGIEVYGLGHGLGLPLKMAWNGMLYMVNGFKFRCKLETFAGYSGSPIFCAETHRVVGILSGHDNETYQLIDEVDGISYVLPKVYLHGNNGAHCTTIEPLLQRLKENKDPRIGLSVVPEKNLAIIYAK